MVRRGRGRDGGYLTYNFRLHHADLSAPLCPLRNDSVAVLSLVTCHRRRRLAVAGRAPRRTGHRRTVRLPAAGACPLPGDPRTGVG